MNEYKKFVEMTKEERMWLVEAVLNGSTVESFNPASEEWVELPKVNLAYLLFEFYTCYRIAPTKPSIDWSHVHPDYKWLATDTGGASYLYTKAPRWASYGYWGYWASGSHGDDVYASGFASFKSGTCKPEDSLVMRPEGV